MIHLKQFVEHLTKLEADLTDQGIDTTQVDVVVPTEDQQFVHFVPLEDLEDTGVVEFDDTEGKTYRFLYIDINDLLTQEESDQ